MRFTCRNPRPCYNSVLTTLGHHSNGPWVSKSRRSLDSLSNYYVVSWFVWWYVTTALICPLKLRLFHAPDEKLLFSLHWLMQTYHIGLDIGSDIGSGIPHWLRHWLRHWIRHWIRHTTLAQTLDRALDQAYHFGLLRHTTLAQTLTQTLDQACHIGSGVPHWIRCTTLDQVYHIGSGVPHWIRCTTLAQVHVYHIGY